MGTKNTDLVANFEASPQVANNSAELTWCSKNSKWNS